MAKQKPIPGPKDEPTKSSVYDLLYSLIIDERYNRGGDIDNMPEYLAICEKVEEREYELKNDAKLLKLQAERDRVREDLVKIIRRNTKEAKKVKRLLDARGLTPEVLKAVDALVDLVNKD